MFMLCVMFCYEIPWFYQDFKSENLFFKSVPSSRIENTGPVARVKCNINRPVTIMLSPPK